MNNLFPKWGVFETEIYCKKIDRAVNCRTSYWNAGAVKAFGGVPRGRIEPNVDIAGRGIVFAFIVPGAIVLLFNLLLILSLALDKGDTKKNPYYFQRYLPRPRNRGQRQIYDEPPGFSEHAYNVLESSIVVISESQILLGLALAVAFITVDRCTLLQYHFMIGFNLILLSSTSHLQSLAIVRRHPSFWGRLATNLKAISVGYILYFIGWILVTQKGQNIIFSPERMPSSGRNDSVILLKAACFMDSDFQKMEFQKMTENHQYNIGLEKNNGHKVEWAFWLILVYAIGGVYLVHLLRFGYGCFKRKRNFRIIPANSRWGKAFRFIYWGVIWCISCALYVYCTVTILRLRIWAFRSGWMRPNEQGGNAEDDITGFGQSAALFSLGAIVFVMLEKASEATKEHFERKEGNEYIQMD